jgi:phosphopantetheinyl transferase (holo-ACP synthase)
MNNLPYERYQKTLPLTHMEEILKHEDKKDIFLPEELDLYGNESKPKSLSARLLIKDILIQHFSGKLSYHQISITSSPNGKPILKILNPQISNSINISISHSRNHISVLVLIEKP